MLNKINPYLQNLSSAEKIELIKVINSINRDNRIINNKELAVIIRDVGRSSLFKTIYFSLSKISKAVARGDCSSIERESLKIQLSDLLQRISKINGSSKDGRPSILSSREQADKGVREGVRMVYSLTVGRYPVEEEIAIWCKNFDEGLGFHDFFLQMLSSKEAKFKPGVAGKNLLFSLNDGEFVQIAYEIVLGRGAQAWEIDLWREKIENFSMSRAEVINAIFCSAYQIQIDTANAAPSDGLSCLVMGTGSHVTVKDWEFKASMLKQQSGKEKERPRINHHRYYVKSAPRYLVSALASLYRGGDFIEQFMENVTGQDGFSDYCELIIVDADSPENEYETIKKYLSRYKNINYIRANCRIGIYDAWNVAAKAARGEYLTNTNLDDLRRKDSLILQASVLENLSFVDIVYQELYYTFDPKLSFEEIAEFGLQTTLPIITPHNMLDFNSPHNAPMWRKKLHDELGFFDTRYRSAGDYEFWLRCISAGKKFYKINDPHVVYYQNPKGLSTRPDTRGLAESCEILKTYARKLVPEEVVMSRDRLVDKLNILTGSSLEKKADRYGLVQSGLRELAISKKYSQRS